MKCEWCPQQCLWHACRRGDRDKVELARSQVRAQQHEERRRAERAAKKAEEEAALERRRLCACACAYPSSVCGNNIL